MTYMIADFEPTSGSSSILTDPSRSSGYNRSNEIRETIDKLPSTLEFLRSYLEQITGCHYLSEGLQAINAHRIMEVGIGYGTRSSLDIMASLASLKDKQGQWLFKAGDLIACDPNLYSDNLLATDGGVERPLLNRFTRKKARVEELAEQIDSRTLAPVDIVISRGVVSMGGLESGGTTYYDGIESGLRIIDAMANCLNSDNDHSCLVATSKYDKGFLPYSPEQLISRGYQILAGEESDEELLKKVGNFYRKAILQKDITLI